MIEFSNVFMATEIYDDNVVLPAEQEYLAPSEQRPPEVTPRLQAVPPVSEGIMEETYEDPNSVKNEA